MMNLSRRDVFLAGFVGFVAWGLAVKLLPVLRYLGYAFISGVLTTILILLAITTTTSRPKKSPAETKYVRVPTLCLLSTREWPAERSKLLSNRDYQATPLYPQSYLISAALDELLDLVLRDFVSSWYKNITEEQTFVHKVDRCIRNALGVIRNRLLDHDLVGIAISRLLPIVTAHLKAVDQADRKVRGRSLNRNVTESEDLDLAIAAKYSDGRLHPAASLAFSDTKLVQQDHLRKILVRILPDLLTENTLKSPAVLVLVKEIVACAVLFPIMQLLSEPDTWNQLIETYGRTTLQDRKTVRRLRAALDEHASPAKPRHSQIFPRLAPNDSERSFERFVKAIRHTDNISDARRFRSQIASQLKRESMVETQHSTYIRRLETGKRVLDQKIARLTSTQSSPPPNGQKLDLRKDNANKSQVPTLIEIMHSASGLSYFMEYMDRLNLMTLVQFWVVVNGFRNPLEDDFGDDPNANVPSNWSDTERTDIGQISEAYMHKPELKVSSESKEIVKSFLQAGRKATSIQYKQARTAILTAQSAVLEELQTRHYPNFIKYDLYYKFLATDERTLNVTAHNQVKSSHMASIPKASNSESDHPPITRTTSQPVNKSVDLRRVAMSSSDMRSLSSSKLSNLIEPARKSLDMERSTSLFDDEYDTDPLANSTHSLGGDSPNPDAANQRQVIENMEAALNNIITQGPIADLQDEPKDSLYVSPTSVRRSINTTGSPRGSMEFQRVDSTTHEKVRPSLAALGLVNSSSRIGVFSDNDLFPDEEKFLEDEYADPETPAQDDVELEVIHEAAPGDLGLAEAISALTKDIERLVSQESVVDALTRKAELTNNIAELRILGKSKSSLQREIRRKELQRQQYMVQENDNSLYGRSSICIKSVMVGKEDDGREFALYLIEVQRVSGDQMPAASWAVARRYSEFHDLYQKLRRRYPSTRSLDFPPRRVVMKLQKEFLHKRRLALEAYLRQLLLLPDVCRSRELRGFLSQQAIMPHGNASAESDTQDIVTRIYNSVTDGMEDFLGNVSALDQLSAAGQSLISAATSQLSTAQAGIVPQEQGSAAQAEAELNSFEDQQLEPFVKPVCDIFLETFELNKGNNWLRGRAVVVLLHQLFGGTVERKVRETGKGLTREDAILGHIDTIKKTMWPGGKRRESKPRTAAEKLKSRKEASVMLGTLIPDMAATVVGRTNAQAAARRIITTMNNERLNQHLAFTILDEIINVLFGIDTKAR